MEKRIILLYQGVPCGRVDVCMVKSRLTLQAETQDNFDGIMRAYIFSSENPKTRISAGVLSPEDTRMRAQKMYTSDALKRLNINPDALDSAELVCDGCSVVKWYIHNNPVEIFSDFALREALTAEREVLCDDCKTPTCVAVPYSNNVRFALAPAFSIVCIENIDGKPYAVIGRNRDGMPFVLKSWKNEEHI